MDSEALIRTAVDGTTPATDAAPSADALGSDPAPAPPAPRAPNPATPWLRGFHGAIVDVGELSSASLRSLALTRRSSGFGRLDVLTTLPDAPALRVVPRSDSGALPVGSERELLAAGPVGVDLLGGSTTAPVITGADLTAGLPTAAETVSAATEREVESFLEQIVADPDEPLGDFIDRRLAEAHFLLLPNRGRGYAVVKRLLDLVIASALLVLASPVVAALVIMIRLDSPGPAFFRQTRVTRGGRTFRFYKFRTMYVDARERFPHLYDYQHARTGLADDRFYKLADDPRNTRVGRWLRRTTLDELPNLFNVLRGDLSMVGPRPDLPELVRQYRPEELACLFTKAGLTGMAQVAGRSLLSVRERLTLDLRYVAHQTMLLDVRILWRTIVVVLSGKGAF